MAISKMSNGFYTFSDNHFKAMKKQDLINYIRTIEKNWENQLITNDIQYANCKKLLVEERNKTIDDFAEALRLKCLDSVYKEVSLYNVLKIAEQLKAGE